MKTEFDKWCCENLIPADLQPACWLAFQEGAKQRDKGAVGFMNERMLSILAQGMTACTTVSHKKTEYARVAIYVEAK